MRANITTPRSEALVPPSMPVAIVAFRCSSATPRIAPNRLMPAAPMTSQRQVTWPPARSTAMPIVTIVPTSTADAPVLACSTKVAMIAKKSSGRYARFNLPCTASATRSASARPDSEETK